MQFQKKKTSSNAFVSSIDWSTTHHPPIIINLLQGHRVEDNVGHHFGEDGAVLDEGLVVEAGLLLDHGNNPAQHSLLQLQIALHKQCSISNQRRKYAKIIFYILGSTIY